MSWNQLFAKKDLGHLLEEMKGDDRLKRALGPISLTSLGIGAVIGSGIFTLTGTAAAGKVIPVKNILEATVLDLLVSGSAAHSQMGRPGAGRRPLRGPPPAAPSSRGGPPCLWGREARCRARPTPWSGPPASGSGPPGRRRRGGRGEARPLPSP